MGAADLPRRPLADKFLHVAIVSANSYQRTKFQISSSISLGDMRGSQNKKVGAPDFPRRPLVNKFLYRALVRANAYTSVPNFNFLAPLVTEIWRGSQNKNWELLISSDAP